MLHIVVFILSISFLIIALMIVISLVQLALGNAPFVPVRDAALPVIYESLNNQPYPLGDESVCIDIGCGNGKVLAYLAPRAPRASFIGIEYSLIPYLMARWNTRNYPNVSILRKNFFTYDFSHATHIFTYLFPQVMDTILETINLQKETSSELPHPLVIISCDFIFTKIPPMTISEIPESAKALTAKKIFTYHI